MPWFLASARAVARCRSALNQLRKEKSAPKQFKSFTKLDNGLGLGEPTAIGSDLSGVSEAIRSMVAACFVVLRNLVMGYEDRTPGNRLEAIGPSSSHLLSAGPRHATCSEHRR